MQKRDHIEGGPKRGRNVKLDDEVFRHTEGGGGATGGDWGQKQVFQQTGVGVFSGGGGDGCLELGGAGGGMTGKEKKKNISIAGNRL